MHNLPVTVLQAVESTYGNMLDTVLTLGILFLSVALVYLFNKRKNHRQHVPQLKGLPLVGNLFDVKFEKLPVQCFEWSKTLGDVFQFSVLGRKIVMLNSSKVIRELFAVDPHSKVTAGRPNSFVAKYVCKNSNLVFSNYGKEFFQRRKYIHKALHVYGEEVQNLAETITRMLSDLKQRLTHVNGKAVNPEELIDNFILGTLQILLIGKIHEQREKLQNLMLETNHNINILASPGADIFYSTFPVLRFTSLPGGKALRTIKNGIKGIMNLLETSKRDGQDQNCVYHFMVKTLQEGKPDWFTQDNLTSLLVIDIVFAGYITTRNALLTLVRVLLSAPEWQKKLQEEVDAIIGQDRQPELGDRYNMPYTEAVVLETFRYVSHVPLTALHLTTEDMEYRGYHIPKGQIILANLWAAHHNDEDWEKPFEFNPSRFLDEDGQVVPADHPRRKNLLTFGSGKRSCVGEVFARTRIFLFITTLMQRYTIVPEDGKVPPMLNHNDMLPGDVQQPSEFKCKFASRLP